MADRRPVLTLRVGSLWDSLLIPNTVQCLDAERALKRPEAQWPTLNITQQRSHKPGLTWSWHTHSLTHTQVKTSSLSLVFVSTVTVNAGPAGVDASAAIAHTAPPLTLLLSGSCWFLSWTAEYTDPNNYPSHCQIFPSSNIKMSNLVSAVDAFMQAAATSFTQILSQSLPVTFFFFFGFTGGLKSTLRCIPPPTVHVHVALHFSIWSPVHQGLWKVLSTFKQFGWHVAI